MTVAIAELSPSAVAHITSNLRESDAREFAALFTCSPVDVFAQLSGFSVRLDGEPIFMFGVARSSAQPHLGVAWGVGTDKAWRAIPVAGRFVREVLIPDLMANGLTRVEVRALATNTAAIVWLVKHMGARFEANLPGLGINGETFAQLSWTREGISKHVFATTTEGAVRPDGAGVTAGSGTAENRR